MNIELKIPKKNYFFTDVLRELLKFIVLHPSINLTDFCRNQLVITFQYIYIVHPSPPVQISHSHHDKVVCEGPEGVKWKLIFGYFLLGKWDFKKEAQRQKKNNRLENESRIKI